MQKLTLRGIAMSTVAYITAITIGIFSVSMLTSNAAVSPTVVPEHITQIEQLNPLLALEDAKELTSYELVELLAAVGFQGNALKTAWAVVMRESRGHPTSHNKNANTGDNSYGLFQINMIGGLGVARRDKYELNSNKDLFDPVVNAQIAYHMSNEGSNWTSWGVGKFPYNGNTEQSNFNLWITKFPEGGF